MNYKILIIGYGSIAKKHLLALKKINQKFDIKVLRSALIQSDKKRNKTNISFIYSLEDADVFNPDIVLLSNPSSLRKNFLSKFYNKILFIEKPLSNKTLSTNSSLFKKLQKSKKLHVGYNLLFDDSLMYLKKILTNKHYGEALYVNSFVGYNLTNWRSFDYRNSVSSSKKLGGGVLLELSHEINYLLNIFPQSKYSYSRSSKISNLEIDVEDFAQVFFKSDQTNIFLHLDFIRNDYKRILEIVTEKTTLIWDFQRGSVKTYDQKNKKFKTIYKRRVKNLILEEWKFLFNNLKNKLAFNNINISNNTLKIIDKIKKENNL